MHAAPGATRGVHLLVIGSQKSVRKSHEKGVVHGSPSPGGFTHVIWPPVVESP
jgi:hypothetical protein